MTDYLQEWIDEAAELIARAVELMTVEQLSRWNGVRAWLEMRPTTPTGECGRGRDSECPI